MFSMLHAQGDSGGPTMKLSGPRFEPHLPPDDDDNRALRYHLIGVHSEVIYPNSLWLFTDDNNKPIERPSDCVPLLHHPLGGKTFSWPKSNANLSNPHPILIIIVSV